MPRNVKYLNEPLRTLGHQNSLFQIPEIYENEFLTKFNGGPPGGPQGGEVHKL